MPELDELIDDDEDDVDAQVGETPEQLIARLRNVTKSQGKQLKQLTKDAEVGKEAAKKLALIEAKLPEDDPKVKFFLDNYKGEFTAEAIRTSAAEYGFIEADKTVTDETNVVEQMMQNSGTRPPDPGTDSAMEREINAITAVGPEASAQIKAIMKKYNRYVEDE